MNRIEVNVTTGERKVIPLTAEEIEESQIKSAAERQRREQAEAAETNAAKRQAAIDALLAEAAKRADAPQAVKDYAAIR